MSTDSLYRENLDYGTMKRTPLWPQMGNERGYYGTNYPMQIEGKGSLLSGIPGAYHFPQRFVLLSAQYPRTIHRCSRHQRAADGLFPV